MPQSEEKVWWERGMALSGILHSTRRQLAVSFHFYLVTPLRRFALSILCNTPLRSSFPLTSLLFSISLGSVAQGSVQTLTRSIKKSHELSYNPRHARPSISSNDAIIYLTPLPAICCPTQSFKGCFLKYRAWTLQ